MIKILLIVLFSIAIFGCAYLSYKRKFKWAAICGGLAAVLTFVGPYIVDVAGNSAEKEKNWNTGNDYVDSDPDHEHESEYKEKDNIIDATCLEAGSYELVSYCKCGKELNRETYTVEPIGHNYMDTITYPSCLESGFTTYVCNRCNSSYVDNYVDVIGHDFVEGICSQCGDVSSEYESLIISRANELINNGNYDEAFNIVSKAMDIASSDSLQQLLSGIQAIQEKEPKYTARSVEFITYSGTISNSDQIDIYTLEAPVDGYYQIDVSDMVSGFYVVLYMYDSNGDEIGISGMLGNGDGVTYKLFQGHSYTIEVKNYSKTGDYTLTIGQQKKRIDITTKEIIYDSIEYKNQQNEYTFVPSHDGTYRFDFSDVIYGFSFIFHIYDSLGYEVLGSGMLSNGDGVTVELDSDEVYTIQVKQYGNMGEYTMMIGKQQATQDITGKAYISGNITYKDQENVYLYTPYLTGEYVFSLNNMISGFYVLLNVYDSLGYEISVSGILESGDKVTAELTEGETYTIYLSQYSKTGSYDINISYTGG